MQPIIKEALKLIRSTIPTTIDIKQDIQTDCGTIKADPTQIHQIVMNLCTNAYHATTSWEVVNASARNPSFLYRPIARGTDPRRKV